MIRSSSSNCNNTNNKNNNNNNKRGNSALVIFSDSNSVRFTLVNSQNYQIFSFLFRSHISVKAASLTKQRGKNLFRNTNCWLFTVKCENYWYNKIPLNCKLNGWRQCWFDRADWITWHCLGGSWHFTSNHLPLCPSLLDPPPLSRQPSISIYFTLGLLETWHCNQKKTNYSWHKDLFSLK